MAQATSNALITFVDNEGREWIAAAIVGPLTCKTESVEKSVEDMYDLNEATYRIRRFTVVLP